MKYFKDKLLSIMINWALIEICKCENILFIAPIASKSHHIFFSGITKGLSKNGHKVG